MASKPVIHGPDHSPRAADPSYTERWHVAGNPGEPELTSPWTGRFKFKLVVGPPGHVKSSLEIAMRVDGGADGDEIIQLPDGYWEWTDGDNADGSGHDSAGAYKAYYVDGSTGQVIAGPSPS